jgi:hypothetical protein
MQGGLSYLQNGNEEGKRISVSQLGEAERIREIRFIR